MYTGFAIALAWPETYCKQAGAWYDGLMKLTGLSKNHYYKVGHAAVVLIESNTGNCHYFDFGRYHAPYGHGRVRDAETDHDLKIYTKASVLKNAEIINIQEIVTELNCNLSCHGTGTIQGSYTKIYFAKSFSLAKNMQEKSPWKYGPFVWNGTNCSRFVRTILLAGKPTLLSRYKLFLPMTISPTPSGNVKCLKNKITSNEVAYVGIDNFC